MVRKVLILVNWVIIAIGTGIALRWFAGTEGISVFEVTPSQFFGCVILATFIAGTWIPGLMHLAGLRDIMLALLLVPILGWIADTFLMLIVVPCGIFFQIVDTFNIIRRREDLEYFWE